MRKQLLFSGIVLLGLAGKAGAQQGPVLLKDINTQVATPGTYNIDPANFCSLNGITYFSGYTPNFGRQIWRTDGTATGTYLFTHTPELSWSITGSVAPEIPSSLTAMNNDLYFFTANQGAFANLNSFNLVRADANGNISRLATSAPAGASSTLTNLLLTGTTGDAARKKIVTYNNNLYFAFSDAQHGIELWKSDGTAAGTTMLTDLISGTGSGMPMNFAVANGYVFFTAVNPTSGTKQDLWRTDGTPGGTIKLRDTVGVGQVVRSMTVVNNKLYFIGINTNLGITSVWQSDGTVAGTGEIAMGPYTPIITPFVGKQGTNVIYYLSTTDGLMKYNGTATQLSATVRPYMPVNRVNLWADVNGTLFFSARSSGGYFSLWKTNGTSTGTMLVKDSISTVNYLNGNGTLYFGGNDNAGNGMELWKSDGTAVGTIRLSDFNTNATAFGGDGIIDFSNDYLMTMQSGKVLLSGFNGTAMYPGANNSVLALSDGTVGGTSFLSPSFTATYDSYPTARIVWNNALYFSAFDHLHGYEFWKTDGTPSGTVFMKDLNPGLNSSYIQGFMPYNSKLYFCTTDTTGNSSRAALWYTDGTSAGTIKVKDTLGNSRYVISKLDTLNGQLIFATNGGVYKSDGTAAGTTRIPTLAPGATTESAAGNFVFLNGMMIMTARGQNSTQGPDEVWKVDLAGNTATRIATGQIVFGYGEMKTFNNAVYFVKEKTNNVLDYALWKTDGTPGGTVIADTAFLPRHLELYDNNTTLYYTTSSSGNNRSYVRKITAATGTPQTVKMFNDIATGIYSYNNTYNYNSFQAPSSPVLLYDNAFPLYPYFIKVNQSRALYFPGGDTVSGNVELMQTDGTTGGTSLVKDILTGTYSGNIQYLTHMLNKQGDSILVFVANDGVHGNELWVSDGTAAGTRNYTETMTGSNTMNPQQLVWLNNRLIFWGSRIETGNEPYVYELNQVLDAGGQARGNEPTLALYPNPAGSTVHVITVGETQVSLYNMAGSKLSELHVPAGVNAIPVSNLAPGIYIIRAMDSKGKVLSAKFIKQ